MVKAVLMIRTCLCMFLGSGRASGERNLPQSRDSVLLCGNSIQEDSSSVGMSHSSLQKVNFQTFRLLEYWRLLDV